MRLRGVALALAGSSLVAFVMMSCSSSTEEVPCDGCSDSGSTSADVTTPPFDAPGELPDGSEVAEAGDAGASSLSLTLSPSSVVLAADASATVSVTVTRPAGVAGPVDVAITGLGLAFSSQPLQIAANASAGDLVISASAISPQGTRVVPVSAKLGALAASASLSLTVSGQPGALDGTFGLGGRLKAYASAQDGIEDMALQPDGKLVVGGWTDKGGAVVRFLADGTLDTSFGTGGVAKVSHSVIGLHLRADGKIVVGGTKNAYPAATPAAITRLMPNGTPDATFAAQSDAGVPGTTFAVLDGYTDTYGFTVQPDGKILLAGYVSDINFNYYRCFLARFEADGTPDATFATGGVYKSDDTCGWLYSPIRVSGTGAIYTNGTRYVAGAEIPVVAKFTSGGALDTTWATSGFLSPSVGGYTAGLLVLPGDALLVGVASANVTLQRFLANGTLDTGFGVNGTSTTAAGSVTDFALQPDGKIAIAATSGGDFLVERLSAAGAYDTTFNGTGWRKTDFGGGGDNPKKVVVTPANAIILGGQSGAHMAITKYLP